MTKSKQGADVGSGAGGSSLLRPFSDDDAALTIGGLSIENGTTQISLSGSLDITKDKAGLAKALALRSALDAIVNALAEASELPDQTADEIKASKTVRNPFA